MSAARFIRLPRHPTPRHPPHTPTPHHHCHWVVFYCWISCSLSQSVRVRRQHCVKAPAYALCNSVIVKKKKQPSKSPLIGDKRSQLSGMLTPGEERWFTLRNSFNRSGCITVKASNPPRVYLCGVVVFCRTLQLICVIEHRDEIFYIMYQRGGGGGVSFLHWLRVNSIKFHRTQSLYFWSHCRLS